MNRRTEVLAGSMLCATTIVTGCSPEKQDPHAPRFSSPTSETSTTPAPPILPEIPGEKTRNLLANDAPIRLIFIPVLKQIKPRESFELQDKSYTKKLLANDPTTLSEITGSFEQATAQRYKPTRITVVKTGAMAINTCLNNADWKQSEDIYAHAAPFRQDNTLNILVVDQYGCDAKGEGRVGGYANDDLDPIITAGSLRPPGATDGTTFSSTAVHEVGHGSSLDHAGVGDCKDVLKIENCKIDPTLDPNSPMSYLEIMKASTDFTSPELWKLGLLDKSEVIDSPASGTYEVVDSRAKGVKLLRIPTHDRTLYFSWEQNEDVLNDLSCKVLKPGEPHAAYTEGIFNGKKVKYLCTLVNESTVDHGLQVRYDDNSTDDPSLAVVTRPDKAPDALEGEQRDTGENRPNTMIYKDEQLEVKLVGSRGNAKAIVQVTRK